MSDYKTHNEHDFKPEDVLVNTHGKNASDISSALKSWRPTGEAT
jgi:hypothetical protein